MPRVLASVRLVIEGARVSIPDNAEFVKAEPGSLLRLYVPTELGAVGTEFDVVLRVVVQSVLTPS